MFTALYFFEGNEYKILAVDVCFEGEVIEAFAFVWMMGNKYLDNVNWSKNKFELESLKIYVDEVVPETVKEFNKSAS